MHRFMVIALQQRLHVRIVLIPMLRRHAQREEILHSTSDVSILLLGMGCYTQNRIDDNGEEEEKYTTVMITPATTR